VSNLQHTNQKKNSLVIYNIEISEKNRLAIYNMEIHGKKSGL
jgi:hypothetical protein